MRFANLIGASLVAANALAAQAPSVPVASTADSVLVTAITHDLMSLPPGPVSIDPEYHVAVGEPRVNATLQSYPHSRAVLTAISADTSRAVTFVKRSGTRQSTHVGMKPPSVIASVATVSVSIIRNNPSGQAYLQGIEYTLAIRRGVWVVMSERVTVET